MTSTTDRLQRFWFILLLILLVVPVAAYMWLRSDHARPSTEPMQTEAETAEQELVAEPIVPQPPETLARQIAALGESFDGDVGIAVHSIDDGWMASHDGDTNLPQQSLSKLWVAASMLEKIDNGEVRLSDPVTLTAADLSIFHQPIRARILASGSYQTTIEKLLWFAMTQSDNTANAALFDRVGGKAGIEDFLARKGLADIKMAESEKELQMGIVGMEWQPSFSHGRNFWRARKRIPFALRAQNMGIYLADPPDAASAIAIAEGLALLADGKLLSPTSTTYLTDLMAQSKTGPKRLRGGLSADWTLPHKTGTGQVLQSLATAYNDVGILKSPGGRNYAVVVMIGATNRPVPERQELMQAVTRALIECEELGLDGCI